MSFKYTPGREYPRYQSNGDPGDPPDPEEVDDLKLIDFDEDLFPEDKWEDVYEWAYMSGEETFRGMMEA